jgi:hypothetical protein
MRPAQSSKIIKAGFLSGKLFGDFYQVHGSLTREMLPDAPYFVKYIIADKVICFDTLLQVLILNGLRGQGDRERGIGINPAIESRDRRAW